jgi:hypothetical protein
MGATLAIAKRCDAITERNLCNLRNLWILIRILV